MIYRIKLYPHLYPRKGLDVGRIEWNRVELNDSRGVILGGFMKQKRTSVEVR